MSVVLGLDTSCYTTSAALFSPQTGEMRQKKLPLPVPDGQIGLRQSEALFHHVRQLPRLLEEICPPFAGRLAAVGASDRPCQADASYMPCFLAGAGAARQIGAAAGIGVRLFSHQQGHVAAALYGAKRLPWARRPFIAFHVSGGTTEALLVEPSPDTVLRCHAQAGSLDVKAGQLIDRVGAMLGLPFPAGPALEKLAEAADGGSLPRPSMEGGNCHLSGVQNQCEALLASGAPREEVARFCIASVLSALISMTEWMLRRFGTLPVVYAGGVMSNAFLRRELSSRFGGVFADAPYSADNACGIAALTAMAEEGWVP